MEMSSTHSILWWWWSKVKVFIKVVEEWGSRGQIFCWGICHILSFSLPYLSLPAGTYSFHLGWLRTILCAARVSNRGAAGLGIHFPINGGRGGDTDHHDGVRWVWYRLIFTRQKNSKSAVQGCAFSVSLSFAISMPCHSYPLALSTFSPVCQSVCLSASLSFHQIMASASASAQYWWPAWLAASALCFLACKLRFYSGDITWRSLLAQDHVQKFRYLLWTGCNLSPDQLSGTETL